MRKPNELLGALMVRIGTYFSGTAREEYFQVAKEISALRKRCTDLEKEIKQWQDTEDSLTRWVDDIISELDTLKGALLWLLDCQDYYEWAYGQTNDSDNITDGQLEMFKSCTAARSEVNHLLQDTAK